MSKLGLDFWRISNFRGTEAEAETREDRKIGRSEGVRKA